MLDHAVVAHHTSKQWVTQTHEVVAAGKSEVHSDEVDSGEIRSEEIQLYAVYPILVFNHIQSPFGLESSNLLWRKRRTWQGHVSPVDYRRMLDSLSHLTSLRCEKIRVDFDVLLAVASHSTLEQLHLMATVRQVGNAQWRGRKVRFGAGTGSR